MPGAASWLLTAGPPQPQAPMSHAQAQAQADGLVGGFRASRLMCAELSGESAKSKPSTRS
eukprot:1936096-Rhodomonas_salina.2